MPVSIIEIYLKGFNLELSELAFGFKQGIEDGHYYEAGYSKNNSKVKKIFAKKNNTLPRNQTMNLTKLQKTLKS